MKIISKIKKLKKVIVIYIFLFHKKADKFCQVLPAVPNQNKIIQIFIIYYLVGLTVP